MSYTSKRIVWKSYLLYLPCHEIKGAKETKYYKNIMKSSRSLGMWEEKSNSGKSSDSECEKHIQNLVMFLKRKVAYIKNYKDNLDHFLMNSWCSVSYNFSFKSCYLNWCWFLQLMAFWKWEKNCFSSFLGFSAVKILSISNQTVKNKGFVNKIVLHLYNGMQYL